MGDMSASVDLPELNTSKGTHSRTSKLTNSSAPCIKER